YDVLEVERSASQAEIRNAYKKLAMKHHPDRNHDDKAGAERRMAVINEAHSLLSDDAHRERYHLHFGRVE
ncbi:DnaJ domain-containing protein, partial [Macrophomina phaseolina]